MERESSSRLLHAQPTSKASCTPQRELFPPEVLERTGRPLRIPVRDPNCPNRTRWLVAVSAVMRDLVARIRQVALTNAIVLLLGESGTGKNLLAWLIHQCSMRSDGSFVHFSAGQKVESLMESELFGHERGAFTGAHEARRGKIEIAQGGTLFMDEIAELGASGQLKFHRLLDDGTFEALGGTLEKRVDVRVIAATHRDLAALTREGRFREDLYHRINVVCLKVPPLRERPEDIPAIAEELLEDLAPRHGKHGLRWSPEALGFLTRLPWIGNVRALRNFIESMVVFSKEDILRLDEFPSSMVFQGITAERRPRMTQGRDRGGFNDFERQRFHDAFKSCLANKSAVARLLCTSRSQVDRLLARFGLPE